MEYNLIPRLFSNLKLTTVKFLSKSLEKQSAYARGSNSITTGDTRDSWIFAFPVEFNEQIAHTWETYQSIGSRLAEKVGEVQAAIADLQGVAGGATNTFKSMDGNKPVSSDSIISTANQAALAMSTSDVPAFRVDTSLVYRDSSRREYSIAFQVMDDEGDPYNTVFKPVRELEKYSCPEMKGDSLVGINFPYIFEVTSMGSDIINIKNAAIISVNPTWMYPFINDYPTRCELTISFKDIEPLYRSSFDAGGIIRTSSSQPKKSQINNNLMDASSGYFGR